LRLAPLEGPEPASRGKRKPRRTSKSGAAALSLDLKGGGNANGSFLRAGLVDEARLAIFPAVDGTKGASCVFASSDEAAGMPASILAMTLRKSEVLESGVVWLRYRLKST
jgi:riboflavin biosynthesis pyrimidine reductase